MPALMSRCSRPCKTTRNMPLSEPLTPAEAQTAPPKALPPNFLPLTPLVKTAPRRTLKPASCSWAIWMWDRKMPLSVGWM